MREAIIHEYFQIPTVESSFPPRPASLPDAGMRPAPLGRLFQPVAIAAGEAGLAVVANAETAVGVVHAVVAFKSDQDHSRTVMDVTIVRDVQQSLVEDLVLNPAVKDWNQEFQVDAVL